MENKDHQEENQKTELPNNEQPEQKQNQNLQQSQSKNIHQPIQVSKNCEEQIHQQKIIVNQHQTEVAQTKIQQVKTTQNLMVQKKQEKQSLYPLKFTTQKLPNVIAKKVQGLVDCLNAQIINIHKLKAYLAEGIPDEAALIREYCWKIILGYLSEEKKNWNDKIRKQTKTYFEFVNLFLNEQKFPDYPLMLKKDHPRMKQLEEDYSLWQQIQKDTSRTHAQLSFFCMPANNIMIPYLTSPRRQKFRLIHGEDQKEYKQFLNDKQKQRRTYRYDYMTRILYIYAKLNPKIQYVQGMNEILAPIFYLANAGKTHTDPLQEAACFFMFNNAISDVIELHIKDLDKSQNGIYGKLNQVNQMLVVIHQIIKVIQPRIWSRLEQLKIDPFFYCFRWMTLLFAQDFQLFDTLRIWQSIFSSENRLDFMNYFAIAIIISAKEVILQNDFTHVLQYLQNISQHIHINQVINIARQLYTQFKSHDFKYHSKKTKLALQKKQKQKQLKKKNKKQQQSTISGTVSGKVNKWIGQLNKFFD